MVKILLLGVALLAPGASYLAHQSGDSSQCSTEYEDHNQIGVGPLRVRAVQGRCVIQAGALERPGVSGACFVLFTENDHRLVASVRGDSDGHFEMEGVAPGRYRLVGRAEGLCTANIPIQVVKSARRKLEIVVHFQLTWTDTCSYGELTAAKSKQ
ncbi:MAG: hypothetical protein ACLQOO_35115 [Terriglobia bacterium]